MEDEEEEEGKVEEKEEAETRVVASSGYLARLGRPPLFWQKKHRLIRSGHQRHRHTVFSWR